MIIVIPADGMKSDSKVSASFGRAPYFFFYDAKTKESTWVKNSAATGPGGAGIKAAQIVVDHGATVLLTRAADKMRRMLFKRRILRSIKHALIRSERT